MSGKAAVLVVDDASPKISEGRWQGRGKAWELNRKDSPWLFERRDTTLVYRFTVQLEVGAPVVIYQPAVFSDSVKQTVLKAAGVQNG